MPKKFLTNIDMANNEIQNAAIHPLGTPPTSPAPVVGQVYTNAGKLYVYDGTNWNTWGQAGGNAFGRITVGSTNIDADNTSDALTIVAGTNVTLTPNASTDTLTIAAKGGNAFGRITVGSTNIDADTEGDALTLVAGSNITLTPNASSDSVTIASSYTDTDTKVTQNALSSGATNYPVLLAYQSSPTSGTASTANYGNLRYDAANSKISVNGGTNYYSLGAAAEKGLGSVADGNSGLVTGDQVYDYVTSAISGLTGPMKYIGTVGDATGATKTWSQFATIVSNHATTVGQTFKVVGSANSTYGVKAGDTIIITDTSPYYSVIPSGDEPSGTVIQVKVNTSGDNSDLSVSPTTSGAATYTVSHLNSAGHKHVPSGGSTTQYLGWSSAGTAAWKSPITNIANNATSTDLPTAKAVAEAIAAAQAGTITPEQISRATFTIASGASSGYIDLPAGSDVFSVSEVQSAHGVVTDWTFANNRVTATLASNATAAVKVNVLYYSGGTIASTAQADYIVDQGVSGDWIYRKWNSGIAECWGSFSHTLAMTVQHGNGWFQSEALYETFPTGLFNAAPKMCNFGWECSSSTAITGLELGGGLTSTSTQGFWAYRIESSGTASVWIYVTAIGTWK